MLANAVRLCAASFGKSQRYSNYLESNFEDLISKSTDLINHYLGKTRALQKDQKNEAAILFTDRNNHEFFSACLESR